MEEKLFLQQPDLLVSQIRIRIGDHTYPVATLQQAGRRRIRHQTAHGLWIGALVLGLGLVPLYPVPGWLIAALGALLGLAQLFARDTHVLVLNGADAYRTDDPAEITRLLERINEAILHRG